MNNKTWVIADLHLGHANIVKFTKPDGSKCRPWEDVHEMNKALIVNWNTTVGENDLVYVLGDFAINRKYIPLAGELKGRKILVRGNHDNGSLEEYALYFDDVVACVVKKRAILTHIPVHPCQLDRFNHNVHGHLHSDTVDEYNEYGYFMGEDTRYTNVSVERINYTPVDLRSLLGAL